MTSAASNGQQGTCKASRACRQRRKRPSSGTRSRSNAGARRRLRRPMIAAVCEQSAATSRIARRAGSWRRCRRAEQKPDADPEQRQQEGDRAGHPHQDAGRRLVVEGGESRQARHLRVVRIEHAVGERQQGRQDGVLHVGQDQVREQQPGRPARPARIGPDDGIPEQQRRAEEAGVLRGSASRSSAGPARRPRGACQSQVAATKSGQRRPAGASAGRRAGAAARQRSSGATQYVRIGRGKPRSSGNSGAPSQRSGGATIMSSRCCTMWTCSSSDGERLDRRGQGQEDGRQPAEERGQAAAVPAPRIAAVEHEPAAQVDRRPTASSAARSQGSNGQERRKASSVGLMAVSFAVVCASASVGRRRPAAGPRAAG